MTTHLQDGVCVCNGAAMSSSDWSSKRAAAPLSARRMRTQGACSSLPLTRSDQAPAVCSSEEPWNCSTVREAKASSSLSLASEWRVRAAMTRHRRCFYIKGVTKGVRGLFGSMGHKNISSRYSPAPSLMTGAQCPQCSQCPNAHIMMKRRGQHEQSSHNVL